jgi:hypothetical protein
MVRRMLKFQIRIRVGLIVSIDLNEGKLDELVQRGKRSRLRGSISPVICTHVRAFPGLIRIISSFAFAIHTSCYSV